MRKFALIVAVLAFFSSVTFASSIYSTCTPLSPCTFDMSGHVVVTATTIDFASLTLVPNLYIQSDGPTPGVFSAIPPGSLESIQNLNSATEPVNTPFGPFAFIAFPTAPFLPALDINFIFPGLYTPTGGPPTGCNVPPAPAVGQQCTPPGSAFSFVNNPSAIPGRPPQASATFVVGGVSADGAAQWDTIFSANFNIPYQQVLAAFGPGGSGRVETSYTAVTTVISNAIPEPGSVFLTITGVFLSLAAALRRRK
jgi:hypothetical protein